MKNSNVYLLGLICALVLSACSGEDDGSDPAGNDIPPDSDDTVNFSPAAINFSNASDIVSSVNYAGQKTLENYAITQYFGLNLDQNMGDCDSGSVVINEQIASEEGVLSAGDSIAAIYDNCVYEDTTVDGEFVITIQSFSGDLTSASNVEISVSVVFSDLVIENQDSVERMDGDLTSTIVLSENLAYSFESSSTMLTVETDDQMLVLENFAASYEFSVFANTYRYAISGTVHSTELEGSVSFDTVEEFSGAAGAAPGSGTIIISGAENSSVTLEVLDVNNVIMNIDADGDGVVDSSTQGDWSTIDLSILDF